MPIALFVHRRSGELHPRTPELIEAVAQRVEAEGIDAWYDLDAAELLGADAAEYDKVSHILDVWFDSGVTHYCVLGGQERFGGLPFPADLYLEGSDQHRGWFQSSLLTSVAMHGVAPYRSVLTHGFTVDAQGRKMSKSLGNVVSPQKVVNALGADILRLWVASTDYRGEMSVSDEILKRTSDAYRRIRNTARFLLANIDGFDPASDAVAWAELLDLDRWILLRAAALQRELRAAYAQYEFHLVYQKVHNFCAGELGAFYLDIIKDRQYTTQADSRARRSAQTAMHQVVEALARWIAPILSFTAEDIWGHIPGARGESVFLEEWFPLSADAALDTAAGAMLDADWERVMALREVVGRELEKLRVAGAIGASLDAEVDLYCDGEVLEGLRRLGDELRFALITSYARVHALPARPAGAVEAALETGGQVWIAVAASAHAKCVRCWHHREDVGAHTQHPELCGRCVENVAGSGETRHHV